MKWQVFLTAGTRSYTNNLHVQRVQTNSQAKLHCIALFLPAI